MHDRRGPRKVVSAYDHVCRAGEHFTSPRKLRDECAQLAADASGSIADCAALLVRDVLWRPKVTLLTRRKQLKAVAKKAQRLYGSDWPSTLPQDPYRDWLREDDARRSADGEQATAAQLPEPAAEQPR